MERKKQQDEEARQAAKRSAIDAWPKLKEKFIAEIAKANSVINQVHDLAFKWTERPQTHGELAVGNITLESPTQGTFFDVGFTMYRYGLFKTVSGISRKFAPQLNWPAIDIAEEDIRSFLTGAYEISI